MDTYERREVVEAIKVEDEYIIFSKKPADIFEKEFVKTTDTVVVYPKGKKFFEEDQKTILGMTAEEWHAFGYGLKDGFKFWKRQLVKYDDIDALNTSPEIKQALKNKYHYYTVGADLPEDFALLILLAYFIATGQAQGFVQSIIANAGVIL